MDDNFNLNEEIREKIRQTINEAKGPLPMPTEMEYMLTTICFVMYKQGMSDGFRISKAAIEEADKRMRM